MLRIAVPNKGALSEPARAMLREAGYVRNAGPRDLVVRDLDNDVEFFFLRPRDIAIYVGAGRLDLGITGQDMLLDSGANSDQVLELGFARASFRLAAPAGSAASASDLRGHRIATAYPGLLRHWLAENTIAATVVTLDGAVENAVGLGVADAVADVVDTGRTLELAGLATIGDPLLASQAVLIKRRGARIEAAAATFIRRIEGVIAARTYVMVDYDIRTDLVEAASAITPGVESPTISPLREEGWVAVRAMVPRADVHRIMDELHELGGRGILVTDILACRV